MEAQAEVEEVVLRLSKSHRPFNAGLYGEMVRQGFAKLWEGEQQFKFFYRVYEILTKYKYI